MEEVAFELCLGGYVGVSQVEWGLWAEETAGAKAWTVDKGRLEHRCVLGRSEWDRPWEGLLGTLEGLPAGEVEGLGEGPDEPGLQRVLPP